MAWILLGVLAPACGAIGFCVGVRVVRSGTNRLICQLRVQKAADLNSLLNTYRRELARWMIQHQPREYIRLVRGVRCELRELLIASYASKTTRMADIAARYPSFSDFDSFDGREYVSYDDGWMNFDETASVYKDIVAFQFLCKQLDPAWKWTQQEDVGVDDHLDKYVRRFEHVLSRPLAAG